MVNEDLKQEVRKLKDLREEKEKLREMLAKKKEMFELENKPLLESITNLSQVLVDTENAVRRVALEEYAETKEKKLEFGIGIRVTTKLNYIEEEALKWAKEYNMALKLDKKGFESIAKVQISSKNPLEFVTVEEKPIATISSELKVE